MTSDALLVLQSLFSTIWSLFTSFKIPGTNVTPAMWAFFLLFAALGLRLCARIFNENTGAMSVASKLSRSDRRRS